MNEQDKKLCERLRYGISLYKTEDLSVADEAAQAIERLSAEKAGLKYVAENWHDMWLANSRELTALKAELRAIARAINDDRLDLSHTAVQIIEEMKAALKAQGEPVAWMIQYGGECMGFIPEYVDGTVPVYAHPPVVSEDAKDAARYRFLRSNHPIHDNSPFICRNFGSAFSQWTGEQADAAIDKAMEKK